MDKSFWEVDPGAGIGPVVLGMPLQEIIERTSQAGLEPAEEIDEETSRSTSRCRG